MVLLTDLILSFSKAFSALLIIYWPSGVSDVTSKLYTNQYYTFREASKRESSMIFKICHLAFNSLPLVKQSNTFNTIFLILNVYGCFSFCLFLCYKVIFSKTELIFDSVDKLLPVSNMASSGLKKILDLIILYTLKSVSENVFLYNFVFDAKINTLFYNGM